MSLLAYIALFAVHILNIRRRRMKIMPIRRLNKIMHQFAMCIGLYGTEMTGPTVEVHFDGWWWEYRAYASRIKRPPKKSPLEVR